MKANRYPLPSHIREAVEMLKESGKIFSYTPNQSSKTFMAAVAVSEMAADMEGIWIRTSTGQEFYVPPGTPWQEALPIRHPDL